MSDFKCYAAPKQERNEELEKEVESLKLMAKRVKALEEEVAQLRPIIDCVDGSKEEVTNLEVNTNQLNDLVTCSREEMIVEY